MASLFFSKFKEKGIIAWKLVSGGYQSNTEQIQREIIDAADSKSTKQLIKYAVKVFEDYLKLINNHIKPTSVDVDKSCEFDMNTNN